MSVLITLFVCKQMFEMNIIAYLLQLDVNNLPCSLQIMPLSVWLFTSLSGQTSLLQMLTHHLLLSLSFSSTSLVEQLVSVAPGRTCQRHRLMFPWSRSMLELHTIPYQVCWSSSQSHGTSRHLRPQTQRRSRPATGQRSTRRLQIILCDILW